MTSLSEFNGPHFVTGYELGKLIGMLPVRDVAFTGHIEVTGELDEHLGFMRPIAYEWRVMTGEGSPHILAISEAFLLDSEGGLVTNEGVMAIGPYRLKLFARNPDREIIYAHRIDNLDAQALEGMVNVEGANRKQVSADMEAHDAPSDE